MIYAIFSYLSLVICQLGRYTHRYLKILITIIVFSISCAATMPVSTSQDQLLQKLVTLVLTEGLQGKVVYITQNPLASGTVIKSWMSQHVSPQEYKFSWFYFVDDHPAANWEHPCRYVFIDIESGQFQIQQGKTPPDILSEMVKLYPDE